MAQAESDIASVLAVLGSRRDDFRVAQELIEVLPVPVYFKARDGRYLGVNRAWEEFFGVTRADFLGNKVRDLYPGAPAIVERHEAMDEQLWANPGRQSYEIQVPVRDGRVRHTIFYKATIARADGEVEGLIGTIVDITERKQSEQSAAIENAVARYLGSDDSLGDAIRGIMQVMCERLDWACAARWSLDESDNLLHCVETWSVEDPKVREFLDASGRETFVPGTSGLIRRVLTTGNSVWVADVTERPDFLRGPLAKSAGLRGAFALPVLVGERVLGAIEFFSREARHPDRWLLQVTVSVGRQIGQLMARREAEEAMRESEERFRSLTELSSDWYWEQDEHHRISVLSRGVAESIAMPPESMIGRRRWEIELVGVTPAQVEAHKAMLDAHQPFQDFEYGHRDASGTLHYVSTSGEPLFDSHGKFRGYRGVGKDITRRKTDEAALREAHDELEVKARELERSNEELQQFAYVASHDLQEPLRMVSSYTQLLGRRYGDRLDGDAREFMEFIVDGAARMKQLIEDLLAYSRVGTRGHELAPTDSGAALAKALVNLRIAQEASGAVVTHDAMPMVVADAGQLTQLFQNLIGNAMKFRGPSAPRIHVGSETRDRVWVFTVRDNGIGLDTQYADRIFMMFQRLHNKTEYPGTGIGLAICKKIVERHGGRIWVDSRPGDGSTFGFTIARHDNNEGGVGT
ncbi:MAG TPA: PAS domain S-box protein [Usitatibacter sp.]|nr:PAS domain S-box protein [Usitatibacter sp.]